MRKNTPCADWVMRLCSVTRFAWTKQYKVILIALVVAGLVLYWMAPWSAEPRTQWWSVWEPILGMATLAVAIFIWFSETIEAWEHSLPKRLKVIYVYDNKPVMVCEDAVLVADSDIRGWALQIGQQMNKNQPLKIGPRLQLLPPRLESRGRLVVRAYELRIELTSIPEIVEDARRERNCPTTVVVRKVGMPDEHPPAYEFIPPFGA